MPAPTRPRLIARLLSLAMTVQTMKLKSLPMKSVTVPQRSELVADVAALDSHAELEL
jgi:hypothetical protein